MHETGLMLHDMHMGSSEWDRFKCDDARLSEKYKDKVESITMLIIKG